MTFAGMYYFGIDLHKISLGALVLSLGLLVDDAIIAVEMMAVKLEQGFDRVKAAAAAWDSTAFPMLTGTLVTAAGFLPIATAQSATGEYTRSIFEVVTLALLLSLDRGGGVHPLPRLQAAAANAVPRSCASSRRRPARHALLPPPAQPSLRRLSSVRAPLAGDRRHRGAVRDIDRGLRLGASSSSSPTARGWS